MLKFILDPVPWDCFVAASAVENWLGFGPKAPLDIKQHLSLHVVSREELQSQFMFELLLYLLGMEGERRRMAKVFWYSLHWRGWCYSFLWPCIGLVRSNFHIVQLGLLSIGAQVVVKDACKKLLYLHCSEKGGMKQMAPPWQVLFSSPSLVWEVVRCAACARWDTTGSNAEEKGPLSTTAKCMKKFSDLLPSPERPAQ